MWGNAIQSCKQAAELAPATRRRLMSDLKKQLEEPIPLAAARPCTDKDLTLWDGVIGVEMEVTHMGFVTVPLHFLIDFPWNYPQCAPNIGFTFDFRYSGGAEYMMPDGRLKGKKVICLDILGNFAGVHTEWKNEVGSGWSPAYTVTTLLVQLQSVLCDLGSQMSQQERDKTYQSAVRFCEKNPSAVLELLDEDEIRERRQRRRIADRLARICNSDEALASRADDFALKTGFKDDESRMEVFLSLLADVAQSVASTASGSRDGSDAESAPCTSRASQVDENIRCFASGKLYTEALLGVGVSRERRNLATAGELLSKEAYDGGLRQSTNKSPFEFFLPVWINEAHAVKSMEWRKVLMASCVDMGSKVFEVRGSEDDAVLEVFPKLIIQLIVEMMKPDAAKSEAIATFEAMCNFWRTLRWLVDTRQSLRDVIRTRLSRFATDESHRHKDRTPDLGMTLVLFTVFQGHEGCPSREAFIKAYADENSLRWVMWWQRSGTKPEVEPVFHATKVSRDILMFQMMVVDIVVGEVGQTLKEIETTNCKLPDRLEKLQLQWRQRKASTGTWAVYYGHIGALAPGLGFTPAWIADCSRRAAAKGPKYGGAKGEGKGAKGNSKGGKDGAWGGKGEAGKGVWGRR